MIEKLEMAMEIASKLSLAEQDELASAMLAIMGTDDAPIQLTAEEKAALSVSLGQAERGEFASEEEIEAIWKRFA
jgi:uncharacterized Zn finger protein